MTLKQVNTPLDTRTKTVTGTVPGGWTPTRSQEAMAFAKDAVRVVEGAATAVVVAEAPKIFNFFPFLNETILELALLVSS